MKWIFKKKEKVAPLVIAVAVVEIIAYLAMGAWYIFKLCTISSGDSKSEIEVKLRYAADLIKVLEEDTLTDYERANINHLLYNTISSLPDSYRTAWYLSKKVPSNMDKEELQKFLTNKYTGTTCKI